MTAVICAGAFLLGAAAGVLTAVFIRGDRLRRQLLQAALEDAMAEAQRKDQDGSDDGGRS